MARSGVCSSLAICPSSSGSTGCWGTCRRRWPAQSVRRSTATTRATASPLSPGASTGASICAVSSHGSSSTWHVVRRPGNRSRGHMPGRVTHQALKCPSFQCVTGNRRRWLWRWRDRQQTATPPAALVCRARNAQVGADPRANRWMRLYGLTGPIRPCRCRPPTRSRKTPAPSRCLRTGRSAR